MKALIRISTIILRVCSRWSRDPGTKHTTVALFRSTIRIVGQTRRKCGWTIPFRTTLKPWKPLFGGIYRGIILPGCPRWCEMDFETVHRYVVLELSALVHGPRHGAAVFCIVVPHRYITT